VVDHVFPQQGDPNDAENFAAWLGRKDLSDYVEFGFTITPDFANNQFSISDGKAHIFYAGARQASNFGSPEDRFNLSYYGYLESRSAISLPNTSGLNNVYVELNLDTDDNPEIIVNDDTTTAYSSESALQIAQVDTSSTSVTELNRVPGYGVPSGAITMWSGSINDIPAGWTLCDGTGGGQSISVPDLQGKFVVGAGNTYSIGDTGGKDQVTLSTGELPSHDHGDGNLNTGTNGSHQHGGTISVDSHDHGNGTLEIDMSNSVHKHNYTALTSSSDTTINEGSGTSTTVVGSTTKNLNAGTTNPVNTGTLSASGSTSSSSPSGTMNDYSAGSHSHGVSGSTSSTGSGNSHENRPNYYSIAYIMKL
jgi:hypothetical protein